MTDGAPKSAFELAMERLRQKDTEQGVERRPVSEAQKAEIAEVRSQYEAKLAQEDVMHSSALATTFDPEARQSLEQNYRRTRERLLSERDVKIERIRGRVEQSS